MPAVAEYARSIPDVAYVQENLFTCSEEAQTQMIEMIKEHNLNRVVVAACSPTTHQPIFMDMLRNAGLNKYLFEMANIRNQCTWVGGFRWRNCWNKSQHADITKTLAAHEFRIYYESRQTEISFGDCGGRPARHAYP